MNVIVIRLEGGLGNQLFQYGYGLALQERHGGRLLYDRRLVRRDPSKALALSQVTGLDPVGPVEELISFGLRAYAGVCIRIVRALKGRTDAAARLLAQLGVHHQFHERYLELGDNGRTPFIYVTGNFMSEKYFESAVHRVRASVQPELALGHSVQQLAAKIRSTNSVALHVRRGDYLSDRWREKLHVCTDTYYEKAVALIKEKVQGPAFYVFSNTAEDTSWVRENYKFLPRETTFVEQGPSDVEHFALMASCRHMIMANSTFSWWAAYLSEGSNKVVVAPSLWNRNAWDMSDLYLPGWALVSVDQIDCESAES